MKTAHIVIFRKFIQLYIILFFIGFCLVLSSCYPGNDISVSEADIVTTFRNESADFAAKQTYAMPDYVVYITDDDETPENNPVLDRQILSAIERNMEQAGFDLIEDPDQADVLVVPMVTRSTWVGGGCNYWYYDPWYGYPGYCYPYYYTYETGTLFIIMVDPAHADNDSVEDALWTAAINGLLSSSFNAGSSEARINRDVNQAFIQSPYLGDGK
jgi:hypothetical protein